MTNIVLFVTTWVKLGGQAAHTQRYPVELLHVHVECSEEADQIGDTAAPPYTYQGKAVMKKSIFKTMLIFLDNKLIPVFHFSSPKTMNLMLVHI